MFLVFRHSYEMVLLPESQRTAVIRCLPKKEDLANVRNWRPISLLNSDYKIFAKCITNPNKQPTSNHARYNTISACSKTSCSWRLETNGRFHLVDRPNEGVRSSQLVVPSCDVGKAKPPLIQNWIRVLYTDISSCVKVNGFSSNTFQITRSVRQVFPLSPILYVIFSEALKKCILKVDEIWGPPELCGRPLLSQFADDTCVGAIGLQSIFAIFRSFALFERASGAKINP